LSPLPLQLRTTFVPSGRVGQRFSKYASACDVSKAGIMPSNRDNLLNAALED